MKGNYTRWCTNACPNTALLLLLLVLLLLLLLLLLILVNGSLQRVLYIVSSEVRLSRSSEEQFECLPSEGDCVRAHMGRSSNAATITHLLQSNLYMCKIFLFPLQNRVRC